MTAGSCVDGERVGDDPAYRARIGYMPQIARFPENLRRGPDRAAARPARQRRRSWTTISSTRFKLESQLGKPLRALSGGTRQKVNAVLAFLFRPNLLVLDEPTSGLDPVSSAILKDKILEVRNAGRTVVVTSHVLSDLDALADDIVFLTDGRVRIRRRGSRSQAAPRNSSASSARSRRSWCEGAVA